MTFKNLKIGQKLAFSFSVVIVLMLLLAMFAYARMNGLASGIELLNKDRYPKNRISPYDQR